jgi:hypothetical protein
MTSAAAAGPAWKDSRNAPDYQPGDAGVLFISALLKDKGDLQAQKDDLAVLYNLAQTLAVHAAGSDRMTALSDAVNYSTGILHLSNPEKWSPDTVVTRLVSDEQYSKMYLTPPQTTAGIAWMFDSKHDTGGSDYEVFFRTPANTVQRPMVNVTILEAKAIGKDPGQADGLPNFVGGVSIGAGSDTQTAKRRFAKHTATVAPAWVAQRAMLPAQQVTISISLSDLHAAPEFAYDRTGEQDSYCAPAPRATDPSGQPLGLTYYEGPCLEFHSTYDINPAQAQGGVDTDPTRYPEISPTPTSQISFVYDLKTGAISGDVKGKKGDVFTVSGNAPEPQRATLRFTVE